MREMTRKKRKKSKGQEKKGKKKQRKIVTSMKAEKGDGTKRVQSPSLVNREADEKSGDCKQVGCSPLYL